MSRLWTSGTDWPDDLHMTDFATVAATADFGSPSARKTGRNPEWPFVPVLLVTLDTGKVQQHQILGLAYATRQEAVSAAERHVERARAELALKLAEPRHRALRESYGLPREL